MDSEGKISKNSRSYRSIKINALNHARLYIEKIPAVTTNLIQISEDGQYVKGH